MATKTQRKTKTSNKTAARSARKNTRTGTGRGGGRVKPRLNVELLEQTFAALAPNGANIARRFYDELFRRYPQVRPLFRNVNQQEQQRKLLTALTLVIDNLRNPEVLDDVLTKLGKRHQVYGAVEAHYEAVTQTLLDVLKEFAGNLWTRQVHQAWADVLNTISEKMLNAYGDTGDIMDASGMAMNNDLLQMNEELTRMKSAVDGALTAIMMVDRDLRITYVNQSTLKLLKQNEDTLRDLYPGFSADGIVGTKIDIFHKNPDRQRQLLSDPANLPYSTDIQVGPLKFRINVTAQIDALGNYIGNTLEWSDVTELRKKETEVARLQSAIDGAEANIMMCDADLNITYANPAVVNMLSRRQDELRKTWPTLDAQHLVGQSIGQFHKNPAHQRAILSDINRLPKKAEIQIGDLEFEVNATAIVDHNGNYLGNMVQWADITEQKDAERQMQNLIENAVRGELDLRVDTSNYQGFMRGLGQGINNLMDTIVDPLREITNVMSKVASGDLSASMSNEFQGEFALMGDAVNTTLGNLVDVVSKIRQSSANIASASSEIAQGNVDLSQRTEEQASSLEQTASSMEELTSTVKQNADNARQANQLAAGARDEAEKGGDVVGNAVAAMRDINEASKKIADIIGVIDEIAFQTNLLALNAAVEAARAGEQGRGFAVVATEVRNLAQRSAGAAKEIKALINDSVKKVEDGSRLVDQSGQTLVEIVNAVKKVSDIVAEIAAASQEQSVGIEQVNKAVVQMDEVTQQNGALVEEAAAASVALGDQAKSLDNLVGFFNVGAQAEQQLAMPTLQQQPSVRTNALPQSSSFANNASYRAPQVAREASKGNGKDDDEAWEEF